MCLRVFDKKEEGRTGRCGQRLGVAKSFRTLVCVLVWTSGVWLSCLFCLSAGAHTFTVDILYAHTPPLSQGLTSTCWAFASASLLESDWMVRKDGDTLRLSPMYVVRQKYLHQFDAYCHSRRKTTITDGSLGHTFLHVWQEDGLMPLEAYKGVGKDVKHYDHARLLFKLRQLAGKAVETHRWSRYRRKVIALLDKEMGKVPRTFLYKGRRYTPRSFADSLNLKAGDYVELTSCTHHPFHRPFLLDVPDNWEQALYYNLPLDELEEAVRGALAHGYTVAWDGDVSEDAYRPDEGVAEWAQHPVTQEMRQEGIEQHQTTDDHMMHIIGLARDENGTCYYIMKNSYGTSGAHHGLMYMSEDYFRAKTVSVMLNRNGLPASCRVAN